MSAISLTNAIRLLVLVFGLLLVALKADQSADFWNYYDRFADRGAFEVRSIMGLVSFLWSSQSFYILMGPFFEVSAVMPYVFAWVLLWSGLCAYGYRGIHWFLFFCFFPGPDLIVNLIRQETALAMVAWFMSINSTMLSALSFFVHPSSLVTLIFLYITNIFEEVFMGSRLRSILLFTVVTVAIVGLVNSPFFSLALARLDAKRGLAQFGSRFIYFVYFEYALLAVLCLFIASRVRRMLFFGTVLLCLFFTVFEIYFYRFMYVFYPFVIFEIGQALTWRPGDRKRLAGWISMGMRVGVSSMSGAFVMLSLIR